VTGQEIGRGQESGGIQNRRLVDDATDWQNAQQESNRTEKQTGSLNRTGDLQGQNYRVTVDKRLLVERIRA
jgi:hypothetical protein